MGVVSVITKHELVLAIIGGLFVLETVSVIVQVASFKLTGRRVFRMAPLHHHFEKKGWQEPTIVIRFWIIASILAIAGLSTLEAQVSAMIDVSSFSERERRRAAASRARASPRRRRCSAAARACWPGTTRHGAAPRREAAGVPLADLAAADLAGVRALVLSPGIPHTFPAPHPVAARAKAAGIPIIGDIELLARSQREARYVGITGTNGKSTTTALIGHILKESRPARRGRRQSRHAGAGARARWARTGPMCSR